MRNVVQLLRIGESYARAREIVNEEKTRPCGPAAKHFGFCSIVPGLLKTFPCLI